MTERQRWRSSGCCTSPRIQIILKILFPCFSKESRSLFFNEFDSERIEVLKLNEKHVLSFPWIWFEFGNGSIRGFHCHRIDSRFVSVGSDNLEWTKTQKEESAHLSEGRKHPIENIKAALCQPNLGSFTSSARRKVCLKNSQSESK